MSMDKITIKRYIEYLRRLIRNTDMTLFQAHDQAISKEVAKDYGVTESELEWLTENLQEVT